MEVNIRISGSAGQGMATAQDILGLACARSGLYAYSVNDVESRIRGGNNFSQLKVSERPVSAVDSFVDILCALSEPTLTEYSEFLSKDGIIISGFSGNKTPVFNPDEMVAKHKMPKASGTAAVAYTCGLLGIDRDILISCMTSVFPEKIREINMTIGLESYDSAVLSGNTTFRVKGADARKKLWISGNAMLSLGAVAGNVSFMSAYPMSPATSIMTNLSQWSSETGIIVEQAEDEISAINMVAGAAYTGARSMTATSGGGFALMVEGVSLLGMIETPAVIVIAQRPGPATGLPTRTMQGDLRMAIHAGHGYFPKVVLAPCGVEDAYEITMKAFDIAEELQVPVIVLTDQHLQDSYKVIENFEPEVSNKRHILTVEELEKITDYKRFALTENGISPMACPGHSKHLVIVDSDEHDEYGHLTEKPEIASAMVEKREKHMQTVIANAIAPVFDGEDSDAPLVMTWGSTTGVVKEAVENLRSAGIKVNMLVFKWLWPLTPEMFVKYMDKARKTIIVENSVSGELESVIREVALRAPDSTIRKVTGRPFNTDELVSSLESEVK